ncbi:retrovirus-related pol polyprotein from transposon TNT 1-94 [Tanacetum coccineum]
MERGYPYWQTGEVELRYIRPFNVLVKVGTVAYRLELTQQLIRVHSTLHVSNLKKCLSDESLVIPLDEIHIDDKLHFMEEPVVIMDREVKRLKQSRIPIIKVRWNSRRGPEFTWELSILAYASFMGFMVYQMDVKSDFLYGQFEEEVYVDDIIFGSTKEFCLEFEKLMHDKFQMSSMGELTFFLGLQVKRKEDGIFISHDKYVTDILKKFGFQDVRTASTPMDTEKTLIKDSVGDDVDVHLYRPMIRSLMYLTSFRPDIMFAVSCRCGRYQCKKQTVVATSTTEVEYVAAASCYGQVLWIQNQLLDYGYNFMNIVINIDNNSTICIIENPVQHSKTKHIEIRHHFIRDCNAKRLIQMVKIYTDYNVADLLTKGFDAGRFEYLVSSIGMLNP